MHPYSASQPMSSQGVSSQYHHSSHASQISQSETEEDLARATESDISDLLSQLKTFTPTIPEDLTKYLLNKAGALVDNDGVKLVSLAAQKFMTELLEESVLCSYATVAKTDPNSRTFKLEDLMMAMNEKGISIAKPQYFFK
ncbi:hypothetical protein P9112_009671 [Eukaryota sp. TZLM1-RC]